MFKWNADGQLSSEENYKDGRLHGKSTSWYESGQKRYERHYENGQLFEAANYIDGLLAGDDPTERGSP